MGPEESPGDTEGSAGPSDRCRRPRTFLRSALRAEMPPPASTSGHSLSVTGASRALSPDGSPPLPDPTSFSLTGTSHDGFLTHLVSSPLLLLGGSRFAHIPLAPNAVTDRASVSFLLMGVGFALHGPGVGPGPSSPRGPGPWPAARLRARPPEMPFSLFRGLLGCILEGAGGPRISHLDREIVLDEELAWFSGWIGPRKSPDLCAYRQRLSSSSRTPPATGRSSWTG